MTSFVVWNMSAAGDGTWKTVDAADARSAAELVCGAGLRSFGIDSEICARVRALANPEAQAVLFYADRTRTREQTAIAEPV